MIPVVSVGLVIATLVTFLPEDKPNITEIKEPTEDKEDTEEKTSYELHKEIEDIEKPAEETITKTFSHGNVTFTYEVGIENGVEETPAPSVLERMSQSYTKEEKEAMIKSIVNSDYWKKRMEILDNRASRSVLAIKADIDSNFTCDNYHYYAKKYVNAAYPGFTINGKYVGTFEGYVYWKAFHECIDPKYQEKLDKVYAELEEVN